LLLAAPKINIRIIAFLNIFHNFVKTKHMKSTLFLTAFLAAASLLAANAEPPTTEAVVQSSERITLRLQGIGGDGYFRTTAADANGNTYRLLLPSEAQPKAGQRITIVHDGLPYVLIAGAKYFDYSTAKPVKP
jgi:hypothetical protein